MSVIGGEGVLLKDFTRTSSIASPGYAFAKQGNVANAYLLFNGIPSNRTGAPMHLLNAAILGYVVATDAVETYDVQIEEHDRSTFTLLSTLNIVAKDFEKKILSTPIPITTDLRLAVKVSSSAPNSATDLEVFLIIRGDLPT